MKQIIVPNHGTIGERGVQLKVLFQLTTEVLQTNPEEELAVDLSQAGFYCPFLIGPLTSLLHHMKTMGRRVTYRYPPGDLGRYCGLTHAGNPIAVSQWEQGEVELRSYDHKTYIPHICFPARESQADSRDKFITEINSLISKQLSLLPSQKNAISLILSEMADNISQHASTGLGYLFAQYFRNSNFMDISIVDMGIGIRGGYKKAGFPCETDKDALIMASEGFSRKTDLQGRGTGIETTRRIVLDGASGDYGQGSMYMISGNALKLFDHRNLEPVELPSPYAWPGTMLLIRLPKLPSSFDYRRFI
ncbi:MAG: hypothetical protein NW241_07415 [Bacteroidia bacterium]|nr:hypothetical protein [Bacteroidia bacterium]